MAFRNSKYLLFVILFIFYLSTTPIHSKELSKNRKSPRDILLTRSKRHDRRRMLNSESEEDDIDYDELPYYADETEDTDTKYLKDESDEETVEIEQQLDDEVRRFGRRRAGRSGRVSRRGGIHTGSSSSRKPAVTFRTPLPTRMPNGQIREMPSAFGIKTASETTANHLSAGKRKKGRSVKKLRSKSKEIYEMLHLNMTDICSGCPPLFMPSDGTMLEYCSNYKAIKQNFSMSMDKRGVVTEDKTGVGNCTRIVACRDEAMLVKWEGTSICDIDKLSPEDAEPFVFHCNGSHWLRFGQPITSTICAKIER